MVVCFMAMNAMGSNPKKDHRGKHKQIQVNWWFFGIPLGIPLWKGGTSQKSNELIPKKRSMFLSRKLTFSKAYHFESPPAGAVFGDASSSQQGKISNLTSAAGLAAVKGLCWAWSAAMAMAQVDQKPIKFP